MRRLKQKKNEKGQAAIEFIAIVVVVFFFLFFYLSLALTIIASEYMDYVTFMAARTYKSGFDSKEVQFRNAQRVFNSYVSKVDGIIFNPTIEEIPVEPENEQRAGLVSNYQVDLFYMPPIFVGEAVPNGRITLQSESRLGRDPSARECTNYFEEFSQRLGLDLGGAFLSQMADNGC